MSKLGNGRLRRGLRYGWFVAALPLIAFGFFATWIAWLGRESGPPSRCYGGVVGGRLEGGRRLPLWGENYQAYSTLGFLVGRTFMHRSVRDAVLAAYAEIAATHPELRYVYAESGWPWGGPFAPHRTHMNGTSVDFHVPVRTLDGAVTELPASLFNKLGYAIDFDSSGRSGGYKIDFEAMAVHLLALEKAARANGISIGRVIFDVRLQPRLFATGSGARLSSHMAFNRVQSWVPHDQHYHVDFKVPCG
jgi:penicillin-insensitive murein endopeptidase